VPHVLPNKKLSPSTVNGYQWALDELVATMADRYSRNSVRILRTTLSLVLDDAVRQG
jgi:hypothetical protein